jgi:hypothetical protein
MQEKYRKNLVKVQSTLQLNIAKAFAKTRNDTPMLLGLALKLSNS